MMLPLFLHSAYFLLIQALLVKSGKQGTHETYVSLAIVKQI